MVFRQISLFSSDIDAKMVRDLNKKFPKILECQINQVLEETRRMLNSKTGTDGEYPNSQLKRWTEIVLRDSKHSAGRKTERGKFTELFRSRKIVSKASDGKSAAANDDTFKD